MDDEINKNANQDPLRARANAETAAAPPPPPPPPPVNAEALLSVKPNGLEASVKIKPPQHGGADVTFANLKIFLMQKKVAYGINNDALKSLTEPPVYDKDIVVAAGTPAENGADAEIIYHVETDRKLKPAERSDGSLDFKDLGTIQEMKKGDTLCEKIPRTEGVPGSDVYGNALKAVPGKDKNLPAGKNTVLSEDKLRLLAETDGHVSVVGGKINILNAFVVEKNVSFETGHINFSGDVIVKGDVLPGFNVNATGNVTIHGTVESTQVSAGGSLIIKGGFQGGAKGSLEAGGNIACQFIMAGRVTLKGDLETSYIMGSIIKCGGEVKVTGKGLIRGGHIMAKTSVTANFYGSPSGSAMTIELGNDPTILERFKEVSQEIKIQEKNIANIELGITTLTRAKNAGLLTRDKAAALLKMTENREPMRTAYNDLKEEQESLEKQIAELGYGTVNVKKTAYPGVKIIIGPDVRVLDVEHSFVTFSRGPEGIKFAVMQR